MPPSRLHRSSGHSRALVEPVDTSNRQRWLRAGAIVAGAALLLWITLANTVGGLTHRSNAARRVVFSPFDSRLQSGMARSIFEQSRSRAAVAGAVGPAERALLRDPTNVEAIWVLGYIRNFQNRPNEARALFRYSDQLSRRDFASRMWLIEERVQANDVEGALRNFDIALRTNEQAPTVLMPILVSAAQDDNIARHLLSLLRTNPVWKQPFFEQLVHGSASHSRAVYLMQGQLNAGNLGDRFIARAAFSRFLRENDPAQAFALYDVIAGVSPASRAAPVRDGGFGQDGDLAPFDWMLTADENLAGIRQGRPDRTDNAALYVYSQDAASGDVARQLLRLGPGRYQLRAEVGNLPPGAGGQPSIRVECLSGANVFGAPFRNVGTGQAFTIPGGNCAFQWLVIAGGGTEGDRPLPWIDNIAIERIR